MYLQLNQLEQPHQSMQIFCLFCKKKLTFSILHAHFYKTPTSVCLFYHLFYLNNHFSHFFFIIFHWSHHLTKLSKISLTHSGVVWITEKQRILRMHFLSLFFFLAVIFDFSVTALFTQQNRWWTMHNNGSVHCSRDHKPHFLVTFSLKMGFTTLFTHLKIILLQCFQFSAK